jgi:HSP20 family protein
MVARYPVIANDNIRLRDAMDRFFGEPVFRTLSTTQRSSGTYSVPVDVFGTESDIFVFASAPGVNPDELEITVDDNILTLSAAVPNVAKSTEAEGATWFLHEMGHGSFKRSVRLPVEVDPDSAEASFENGILRLRLPKAQAAKPRQIKVRTGAPVEATPSISEQSS